MFLPRLLSCRQSVCLFFNLSKCGKFFDSIRHFSVVGKVCCNGNVYLMGPPGAGKTTVGQLLSRKMDMPVLDIDNDHLEPYWGMTVAEKLEEVGPDSFVQVEGNALLDFHASNSIVSLSGSNPMHPASMDHIRRRGTVVFMDVNSSDILSRLERMKVNRIVGQTTGMNMADILNYRRQFYLSSYDLRVVCEKDESAESIAQKVYNELQRTESPPEYTSTRGQRLDGGTFCDVTLQGLADDGGLFLPCVDPPVFSPGQWQAMASYTYTERAIAILEKWIHHTEISPHKLRQFVESAYSTFDHTLTCPVVHLLGNVYLSELFHGPSASFKDMALQLMPHFFHYAITTQDPDYRYLVIVATSGDTGGAVLDGFSKHAENVAVVVLYPEHGISSIQKAQMTSAEGRNVMVVGVNGDFDFCQSTIKDLFTDGQFGKKLREEHGIKLSAANSINWARLLPQVVYHASSYLELVKSGIVAMGDQVDLCIPTGNFGNILGAYYAKCMGIPVGRLVCASNVNNVLTEFIHTGVYRIDHRHLMQTMSPAIDILKSSNLERYLYHKCGRDPTYVTSLYNNMNETGRFDVGNELLSSIQEDIVAGWCDEAVVMETIKSTLERTGMLLDPHTAVAKSVVDQLHDGKRPVIISSTAHYAKFPEEVLTSIGHSIDKSKDGCAVLLETLEAMDLQPQMHREMRKLKTKERIHHGVLPADVSAIKECIEMFMLRT